MPVSPKELKFTSFINKPPEETVELMLSFLLENKLKKNDVEKVLKYFCSLSSNIWDSQSLYTNLSSFICEKDYDFNLLDILFKRLLEKDVSIRRLLTSENKKAAKEASKQIILLNSDNIYKKMKEQIKHNKVWLDYKLYDDSSKKRYYVADYFFKDVLESNIRYENFLLLKDILPDGSKNDEMLNLSQEIKGHANRIAKEGKEENIIFLNKYFNIFTMIRL